MSLLGSRVRVATVSVAATAVIVGSIALLLKPSPGAPTRRARNLITALRALPSSPLALARPDEPAAPTPAPDVLAAAKDRSTRVTLPGRSTKPLHVEDARTGIGVEVQVRDVFNVVAEAADGYFVYPHAHGSGGTLIHRQLDDGVEDFVSFETRPAKPEIAYDLTLKGVRGVRLVEGVLELLDGDGAPRLRAAPPFIVGADGARTDATLALEGCAVDTDPAAPWGRTLTPPGRDRCTLRVRWNDEPVKYPAVLDPRWSSTQNMTSARQDFTATMMSTGKVLAVGGRASGTSTTGLTSAELFDPTSRTWATTSSLSGARYLHSATQLGTWSNGTTSGKVLVAGGTSAGASVNTAQLYSPSAGTWTGAANLPAARNSHTATVLGSGKVLLAGGLSGTTLLNTAVIYDPSSGTGTFTATGNMPQAVKSHTATLLAVPSNGTLNNKVLVVGGNNGSASVANVQLFDGTSGWSSLAALSSAREQHTATALANGNVLVVGGRAGTGALNTTLLFNAGSGSGSWGAAGNLTTARQLHTATLLPSAIVENGQVMVAGGSSGSASLSSAEVWNGTSTWTATASLTSPVQGQTATLLNNNLVLLAGGANGSTTVATATLFDGSFALNCTSNAQCATGFCVNGVCCDTACTGGCGACNLSGKVGTCSPVTAGTVCRAATDQCDQAEACSGSGTSCPTDAKKTNGSTCNDGNACTRTDTCQSGTCTGGNPVVCSQQDQCHVAGACNGSTGACSNPPAQDGTTCDDGIATTAIDACRSGSCVGTADPNSVLGFESLGLWSFSGGGTVVGLGPNHTQGGHSLEIAVQNYQPLVSARMATLSNVAPIILLDILLPSQQANPDWFGNVQLFVNAPSVGINNAFLGQVELSGTSLSSWETLAFSLTSQQVTALTGAYTDLTFTIALNAPFNETGHYLLDNFRFAPAVTPAFLGTASDSNGVPKALFGYQFGGTSAIGIAYGPANFLSDANGYIKAPLETPPTTFSPAGGSFVATLAGPTLTWTVAGATATATAGTNPLPTVTLGDGTFGAQLPDGSIVPLDAGQTSALANTVLPTEVSFTATDQARDQQLVASGRPAVGPSAAGTVPGTFQVTNDGAAEYQIALDVPRGRGGVEPRLSLVYNSRSGDGVLGTGWALRGIDRITRCRIPYNVAAERGHDPSPVTYTDADDFCVNGERLISTGVDSYRSKRDVLTQYVVLSRDAMGPVTFKALRKDGMIEYFGLDALSRGERSRITSISGGQSPGQNTTGFTTVRREWYLSQVSDRFGNQMQVQYTSNATLNYGTLTLAGPRYPSTITYTSNPGTGRQATNKVTFQYTGFLDAVAKFESGVVTNSNLVLGSISMSAPNPVKPSVVTTYKFTYETPGGTRVLLDRLQKCDGAGVCLAPTTFDWDTGPINFQHSESNVADAHYGSQNYDDVSGPVAGASRVFLAGDFNQDGIDDLYYRQAVPSSVNGDNEVSAVLDAPMILRLGGPTGFGPAMHPGYIYETVELTSPEPLENWQVFGSSNLLSPPVMTDLTGDGLPDLIVPFLMAPGASEPGRLDIYKYKPETATTVEGFLPTDIVLWDQRNNPASNIEAQHRGNGRPVVADIDGNGLPDVGRQLAVSSDFAELGVRLNNGGVLSDYATVLGQNILWEEVCGASCAIANELLTTDLDGDGRTEIVMSDGNGHTSGVHAGQFGGMSWIGSNIPEDIVVLQELDYNGDGLIDFIATRIADFVQTDTQPGTHLWINSGNGYYPLFAVDPILGQGIVVDLDGDGMDDVVVPACSATSQTAAVAYMSTGAHPFAKQVLSQIPASVSLPDASGTPHCVFFAMDVNGDGQKDFLQSEHGNDNLQMYTRVTVHPSHITTITDGVAAVTSLEYSRYQGMANDACQYPYACTGRNVEIVSGYTVDNGILSPVVPLNTHYTMSYAGPRIDAQGAGWLGFDRVTATNDITKVATTKEFDLTSKIGNWFPLVGLPITEKVIAPLAATGRTVERRRDTIYKKIATDPNNDLGPYSIQPSVINETEFEVAGTTIPQDAPAQRWVQQTFTYDGYGNVLTHDTIGKLTGSHDAVTYDVTNDAANWLLGQVNSITETSTSAIGEQDQRVTTFQIDPATGAVTGKTIEPADPQEQLAIVYTRNGDGLITDVTETPAVGSRRSESIGYDPIEGTWPASWTNALGQVTRVQYHCGLGVLAQSTDPNNAVSQWQYDGLGRLRGETRPSGFSLAQHLFRLPTDNHGVQISWSASTGRSGVINYDDRAREVLRSETAFDQTHQLTVARAYDPVSGNVATVTRPFGATPFSLAGQSVFKYDELGRVTSIQPPEETARTISYTGLKTSEFLAGVLKKYEVDDGMGHIVAAANYEPTSSAPNQEIRSGFDYGPFWNLRHAYAPGGATTTLSYDHLGRRTDLLDPDSGEMVSGYNSYGELILGQPAGQEAVSYTRDVLGRLTAVTQGTTSVSYTWDQAQNGIGYLSGDTGSTGVTSLYGYQPNGLPSGVQVTADSTTFQLDWSYDTAGRLQKIVYPQSGGAARFAVTLGYGGDGRVSSLTNTATGGLLWQKSAVANDGQTQLEGFGDGVATLRSYEPTSGRLFHIATGTGDVVSTADTGLSFSNALQSLAFGYMDDGKLKSRSDEVLGTTEMVGYDNVDRLTSWSAPSAGQSVVYSYDDAGNLTTRQATGSSGNATETYTYGQNGAGPHALTTGPAGSYGYDPSGRQTSRPGQPSLSYTYFDLPVLVTNQNGSNIGFEYDAWGTRVVKSTSAGSTTTVGGLFEQRVQQGQKTYVMYLRGDGGPIGQIQCDATGNCAAPAFFHPDNMGSVDMVESQGVVVGREKRDPFGRAYKAVANMSDPDDAVALGFTGQPEDSEVGLVNFGHRLYDPKIGRFVSPDPLVDEAYEGQAYNRYAYVRNSPLELVDPTGLQATGSGTNMEPVVGVPGPFTQNPSAPEGADDTSDASNWVDLGTKTFTDGFGQQYSVTTSCEVSVCGTGPEIDPGRPGDQFQSLQSSAPSGVVPSPLSPASSSQNFINGPVPAERYSDFRPYVPTPASAGKTGWDLFSNQNVWLDSFGMPHGGTTLAPSVVNALQPIFNKAAGATHRAPVQLSHVEVLLGTKDGRSRIYPGFLNISTPGDSVRSYPVTLASIFHELGHQLEIQMYGSYESFWKQWKSEYDQYGERAYDIKGTLEYQAQVFMNQLLDRQASLGL